MINIFVCVGSACHLKGSYNIIHQLQKLIDDKKVGDRVMVKATLCFGKCSDAVVVSVDDDAPVSLAEENVESFFEKNIMPKLENN